jgi:hypothetical protein
MNEISFNDKFESVWCRDTLNVEKTPKPLNSLLCTSISLKKIWNNIHLNTLNPLLIKFQYFVKLPINFYNRILKDSFFFISVQLRDIYRFLWKIALLTISYFFNTRFCIAVLCVYVHDVIKCMFLFSLEVSWQLLNLYLVKFR